jgi:hypothetical protein
MGRYRVRTKIQFFDTCWSISSGRGARGGATRFYTLAEADAAAEKYSSDRGYLCEGFFCEACEYFHVGPSQAPPGSIPDEDRWSPAKHRERRALIQKARAEEQAARHAEEEAAIAARRAEEEAALPKKEPKPPKPPKPPKEPKPPRVKALSTSERRALGLCGICGKERMPGHKLCPHHVEYYRKYYINYSRKPSKKAVTASRRVGPKPRVGRCPVKV